MSGHTELSSGSRSPIGTRILPHSLSSASLISETLKGGHAEPDITEGHVKMASISMPPPPPPPRSTHPPNNRDSTSSSVRSDEVYSATPNSPGRSGSDVSDRSRASTTTTATTTSEIESGVFPSAGLANGHSRPQKSNRVSNSSLYSLNSVVHTSLPNPPVSSSAASASSILVAQCTGVEPSSVTSLGLFSGQDSVIAASTAKAATSPVSVVTSSSSHHVGSLGNNLHQLEPKDQSALFSGQPLMHMAHLQSDQSATPQPSVTSSRTSALIQTHPDTTRSRSRTKRQQSRENTNAGSQSPGSDRGFHIVRDSRDSTGWYLDSSVG